LFIIPIACVLIGMVVSFDTLSTAAKTRYLEAINNSSSIYNLALPSNASANFKYFYFPTDQSLRQFPGVMDTMGPAGGAPQTQRTIMVVGIIGILITFAVASVVMVCHWSWLLGCVNAQQLHGSSHSIEHLLESVNIYKNTDHY